MRKPPESADRCPWDVLQADPDESLLDLTNPDVIDGIKRRTELKAMWKSFLNYPEGHWPPHTIKPNNAATADMWRCRFLRRAWEGIQVINHNIVHWSQTSKYESE